MDYELLLKAANSAGLKAGNACKADVFQWTTGDGNYEEYPECGCAWVVTREHGSGAFVKYLKNVQHNTYKDSFYKGWNVETEMPDYGQAWQPKYEYCKAFVKVLNMYDIKATAHYYLTQELGMFNECYDCYDSYPKSDGEYIVVLTSEDDGYEVWVCHKCLDKEQ